MHKKVLKKYCQTMICCCIIKNTQQCYCQEVEEMQNLFKKIRLRSFAIFLLIVYLAGSFISAQFELMTKKREYENVLSQQTKLQLAVDDTKSLLAEGADRVYIERVAREKLGYAYPGERIFIDIQAE